MFASVLSRRKVAAALAALTLASACAPAAITGDAGGARAPDLVAGAPVPVALLVPAGSAAASDNFVAQQIENAARLAIADLGGVAIDLRVYPTGASEAQAGAAASQAVAEGAAIILGPLRQEEATPAGLAAAAAGVNVLAFTNNPTVAGGNVFILGPTFQNTAERLIRWGQGQGIDRYVLAHGTDTGGGFGRDAIVAAANVAGATVAAIEPYPLSQAGIAAAGPRIAATAQATGAQAIFTTADPEVDLPFLAAALPPGTPRLVGLTRWSAVPEILAQPSLEGGLFAVPDQAAAAAFETRYRAAYGEAPLPVAALAFDGIAAIGALAEGGGPQALSRASLTQGQGFEGTAGIFRLNRDGTNARGLAVAQVQAGRLVILDLAPRSFSGAGS